MYYVPVSLDDMDMREDVCGSGRAVWYRGAQGWTFEEDHKADGGRSKAGS